MFSNHFSSILNDFLIYYHICFNYVSFVQIKKSPFRGFWLTGTSDIQFSKKSPWRFHP